MRGKTIAVNINKGGTGKTTSVCSISQVLALCNYKVLLIDVTEQKDSTRMFGMEKYQEKVCFEDLLTDDVEKENIMSMITETPFKNLYMIPATQELKSIGDMLHLIEMKYSEPELLVCLKDNLWKIKDEFDYILFDSDPGMNRLNKEILVAADEVIASVQTDAFSASAIASQNEIINRLNNLCNTNTRLKAVYCTQVNCKTNIVKQFREELKKELGTMYIDTPISNCSKVVESNALLVPLFQYAPKCKAAKEYIALVISLGWIDREHYTYIRGTYKDIFDRENQ